MQRRGFTLIELLVVMSVISVLAAVLLPALQATMVSARGVKCMSNLKQIGIASCEYSDQWNSYLPCCNNKDGMSIQWKYDLGPYLGIDVDYAWHSAPLLGKGVFDCPVFPRGFFPDYGKGWEGGMGWNHQYLGTLGGATPYRVKTGSIELPSDTVLAGDGRDWTDGNTDPALYGRLERPQLPFKRPGTRHKGGINLLWADLHVSWMLEYDIVVGKGTNFPEGYYYRLTKDAGW